MLTDWIGGALSPQSSSAFSHEVTLLYFQEGTFLLSALHIRALKHAVSHPPDGRPSTAPNAS